MVKKVLLVTILTIFTFLVVFDVRKNAMAADEYKWLPTACADYNYPMQITDGKFIFKSKDFVHIPDKKIISNGWGEAGSIYMIGEHLKPIPEKMMISWFSYTENKFYSGVFDLPYEKIKLLFENGFIDPVDGKKATYDMIMVGLAPEGEVSVWLTGGITTEVGNFQAGQANINWSEILDNPDVSRENYIQDILEDELGKDKLAYLDKRDIPHSPWRTPEEIAKLGMRQGLWKAYRQRYSWEPVIAGISKPSRMWIKSFNGENYYIDFPVNKFKQEALALPRRIKINWVSPSGGKFTASIIFDEQEIFRAFQKLKKYNAKEVLKLQIEIGDKLPTVGAALKNSEFILKLDSGKIKINRF